MNILRIKHTIGNIFHIKSWSDNYKRNISNEALNDAYTYVVTKHRELYNKLNDYYKERNIATPLKHYDIKVKPKVEITKIKQLVPHKMAGYDKNCYTVYVYPSVLFMSPIEYRSLLVHELIHHVYSYIHLSYGGIRWMFDAHAIGLYEQNPEEFIADYWRLFYEGYDEQSIVNYLAEWYFKGGIKYNTAVEVIILLRAWGYIPM